MEKRRESKHLGVVRRKSRDLDEDEMGTGLS